MVMLLLCTALAFAQTRTITGKVFDAADGSALSGVTVAAGRTGVQTDADGNFSLLVPSSVKSITISFVGYVSKQVSIGSESNYDITLTSTNQSLEEVVVIGYGTQRKKDVTGNLASVNGAAVASKPVQSFEQALGGRAAGVQVTIPNGVLNAPPVVRIRGTNSISLSSAPLYVVDGVPVYSGDGSSVDAAANVLSSINPNDIESIDIAKDAAAAAIYGSRAANGVVFITTKKGKSGKAKVSLDSWVGWSSVQRLPKMMDAFQYTDYKNQALRNAGTYNDDPARTLNYFALTNGPDGKPINTNWYDEVYRVGVSHSHTVSVSGASEATNYYISVGYTNQQGILKRNEFNRKSVLANVNHKVNKALSVGAKINYSNSNGLAAVASGSLPGGAFATAGLGRAALVTAPNVAPFNNDGSYNYSGTLIGVMDNKVGQVGFNNPRISMDLNRANAEINQVLADAYVQLKPVDWITLKSQYSINYLYVDNELYWSPISGEGIADNGSATSLFNKNKRWVWSNTIQFDKTFGAHSVQLLGGTEQQKSDNQSYGINRINVSDPDFTNIQGGWATPNIAGMGIGENYLLSYFGRIGYDFAKKYYISGNIRRDGASQLGANVKYGNFWGVSAGWEITKEKFWESANLSHVFSSFKVRGSYGKVGNISGLGQYASLSTFGSGLYGGNGTVVFSQAGNPDLTWETSTKTDIGINYGFLNDRITGELTYYHNDISGMILYLPSPPSAGLPSSIPTNVGSMYNKGWEFLITATPVETKNFSWTTSLNVNYNKNKVTALADKIENLYSSSSTSTLETANTTVVGQPLGMLFVTRTAGVDPASGRRIFINRNGREVYFQHIAPTGQYRFSYADGTVAPTVSNADAVVYKNTNPKFIGGFDNTFRFREFELNALFVYQFGNYIYYGTNAGLHDQRFWNNSVDVLQAWNKAGDVTHMPRPVFGDNVSNGSSFPMDINVFRGDFVKLRTLTLAYNMPGKLLGSNNFIRNARFYVAGNNLLILTKYPGPDPEVSSNGDGNLNPGVDRNTVGNQRVITVGINVGF